MVAYGEIFFVVIVMAISISFCMFLPDRFVKSIGLLIEWSWGNIMESWKDGVVGLNKAKTGLKRGRVAYLIGTSRYIFK